MTDDVDHVEAAVRRHLDELGIEHELMDIDPALADTAAFCEAYDVALEDSANCIIVASRDEPPVFAACLVLATTKLDVNKRVRKLLGVRKLSFASAEQTRELTGMEIGGVTPFALPADLPLYVDERVRGRDRVVVGGGSRALKVVVRPGSFAEIPNTSFVEDLALEG